VQGIKRQWRMSNWLGVQLASTRLRVATTKPLEVRDSAKQTSRVSTRLFCFYGFYTAIVIEWC
jgi:hypothetical protein